LIIDPNTFERFNAVLTGVIVPRPIAFVSTMAPDGVVNLAPYSFFNAVSYSHVVFSSSRHVGNKSKDTLRNIEETGQFVVNIVVDPIADAMNATAAEYPEGVDEFEIAGLTHAPSQIVKPPRVAESPVNIECELDQIIQIGSGREGDGNRHASIARGFAGLVQHPIDAVDFLLDRIGDRIGNRFRRCAGIDGCDRHRRRDDVRILADRQEEI